MVNRIMMIVLGLWFMCSVNELYAAHYGHNSWYDWVQTSDERENAIKEVKNIDLPALRARAKLFKQKLEKLAAEGKNKIRVNDPLTKGINSIISSMYSIHHNTGLPTYIPSAEGFINIGLSQLIFKLEEIIATIDSIIGLEK